MASVQNATNTDIAAMLEDSLSRTGKGGMASPFPHADGSSAAPGITFDLERGTGLYRSGAGTGGFSALGVIAATWAKVLAVVNWVFPGNITVTTDASVGGNVGVTGDLGVGGDAGITGTLGVTGVATFTAQAVLSAGASAGNQKIVNLLDPTLAQDAATKAYVDNAGALSAWAQPTNGVNATTLGLRWRKVAGSTIVFYGKVVTTGPTVGSETLFTITGMPPYGNFVYLGAGEDPSLVLFSEYMRVTIIGGNMAFSCERVLASGTTIPLDNLTFQTTG
jgi:hypothetical protein